MSKPYTVVRRTTVNAPGERVRALVHDFHEWPKWSPWEDVDPAMRRTFSGPEAGVGAGYAWEGNRKAGKGSMTVTGDTAQQVDIDLRFEKPFAANNRIELVMTPQDEDVTDVEWRMHGELSGFMRVFSLVKSMDSLIGPDFEKGLATLKRTAETA
ncbi:MAG TPA: SRPBCC family protein [Ornithinibacter sp.]|nr:SRPBCC family protein [Ornithinibacter sp.]